MIDSLSKRLLSASRLGVVFDYQDGHRWIDLIETNNDYCTSLYDMVIELKIFPSHKIYGDIYEALDVIDIILKKYDGTSLESRFDFYNNWFNESSGSNNSHDYLVNRTLTKEL